MQWRIASAFLKYGGGLLLVVGLVAAVVMLLIDRNSWPRQQWRQYEAFLERDCRTLFLKITGRVLARYQLLIAVVGTAWLFVVQGFSYALLTPQGWIPLGILHALVWGAPRLWFEWKKKKRQEQVEEQTPKWIQLLADTLRVTPAIGAAIESTGERLKPPLSQEVGVLVKEIKLGVPLDQAVQTVAVRVDNEVFTNSTFAIVIARRTGGDLPTTLARSASALREIQRLERVFKTKTADVRVQITVFGALYPGAYIGGSVLVPWYFTPLYTSESGMLMLAGSVATWAVAMLMVRQMMLVKP